MVCTSCVSTQLKLLKEKNHVNRLPFFLNPEGIETFEAFLYPILLKWRSFTAKLSHVTAENALNIILRCADKLFGRLAEGNPYLN